MNLDTYSFLELSDEQQEAILIYAAEKGDNWKEQLSSSWEKGTYNWNHSDKSHLLQEVRNQFGPSWLADVCIPEVIKYEILLPERFAEFQLYKLLGFYQVCDTSTKNRLIQFDGPVEVHNYESAITWMEDEIASGSGSEAVEYYENNSYLRHIEGN